MMREEFLAIVEKLKKSKKEKKPVTIVLKHVREEDKYCGGVVKEITPEEVVIEVRYKKEIRLADIAEVL